MRIQLLFGSEDREGSWVNNLDPEKSDLLFLAEGDKKRIESR